MKGVVKLDPTKDLYLSMTWNIDSNHGVSGHIYEIIDYYLLMRNHFKVGILICEDLDWATLRKCITTKYNVDSSIVEEIKSVTIFYNRPKYVLGKTTCILFVDGGMWRSFVPQGVVLLCKYVFSFRCSYLDTHYNLPYKNIILLQDNRVYNDEDNKIAIPYKKKINFTYYKKEKSTICDTALLYLTSNCRAICPTKVLDIVFTYNFKRYIILSNKSIKYKRKLKDFTNISFPKLPLESIFSKFSTFIYTATDERSRNCGCFDCSPRFIAECKFYNKDIIYHQIDDAYLTKDTGLRYRKYDIENDFNSIFLTQDDSIISIIKEYV